VAKQKIAARSHFSSILAGGDRRSLGRANSIVALVLRNPRSFSELLKCLWSDDAVVRMRAADAAEKLSEQKPELLQPFKAEILGLADESQQQEVQWHMALMIPRLHLTVIERRRAAARLQEYLASRSSIVKTHALQGLSELGAQDEEMRIEVLELLESASRHGTAAMKARARILLARERKRK
jgi:hypothetical protein